MLPSEHRDSPPGEVWDACAACDFACTVVYFWLPFGCWVLPSGEVQDVCAACDFACAVRGREGLLGAAPLLDPLCTPPGTPPKRDFQLPEWGEGTRLVLRELPSLAPLAQVISLRDA